MSIDFGENQAPTELICRYSLIRIYEESTLSDEYEVRTIELSTIAWLLQTSYSHRDEGVLTTLRLHYGFKSWKGKWQRCHALYKDQFMQIRNEWRLNFTERIKPARNTWYKNPIYCLHSFAGHFQVNYPLPLKGLFFGKYVQQK